MWDPLKLKYPKQNTKKHVSGETNRRRLDRVTLDTHTITKGLSPKDGVDIIIRISLGLYD